MSLVLRWSVGGLLAALTLCPALWADSTDMVESHFLRDISRLKVDEQQVAQAGIRKLAGKRIAFYTDLPSGNEIDALPEIFDQAFPQWREYFGVAAEASAEWRALGCLMKDRERFRRAGLLPPDVPDFPNGYARNFEFWLFDQPTDYYRRHLFLHEGTHVFMITQLGAMGPPWFGEGLAELLGLHRWRDGRLTLGYLPLSREETPLWGRIRIIQDAVAARRALRWQDVLAYDYHAHRQTEPYAWCWAAATLLERQPRYRARFHELFKHATDDDASFSARVERLFAPDWQAICEEWQLLVANMEYGYDVPRSAVDFAAGRPLPPGGARLRVAADRGWQNTGVRLEAGRTYRLTAAGRCTLAQTPRPWSCEPNGVSIRYYRGQPLGLLLAAVRSDQPAPGATTGLLRPWSIGLGAALQPSESGTLFLKLNDSPAELADNQGAYQVRIE